MNRPSIVLAFLFFITCGLCARAQNSGFSVQELGFDPGDILMVTPPNPEDIESFAVAQFRGLLRIGLPRTYYSRQLEREEFVKTAQQRKDLDFRLRDGLSTYFSLVYMDVASATMNTDNIRKAFIPGMALEDTNAQYAKTVDSYWAIVLKGLGARLLKPEVFYKYFCPDAQPCLPTHMPKSSASYQQKLRQARWAGGKSEFAEMRAFNDFMDTHTDEFISWSKNKLPAEVYFVGRTTLGEYNFDAGGFVLRDLKAVSTGPVTIEDKQAPETSLFKLNYTPEGQPYQSGILIPMSAEKAEQLINKLKSGNRSRQLYYVYRAKIQAQFVDLALENTNYHMMVSYTQEPTSRTIEFFSDDALSEKVFEITN